MPFANAADYVRLDIHLDPPLRIDQLHVKCLSRNGERYTQLFMEDELFAELTSGAKPGWSKPAKIDGPLVKVLEMK